MSTFAKSGVTTYIKTSSSSNVDGRGDKGKTSGSHSEASTSLLLAAALLIPFTSCILLILYLCCYSPRLSKMKQTEKMRKFDAGAPPVKPSGSQESLEKDQLVVDHSYPPEGAKRKSSRRASFKEEAAKVLSQSTSLSGLFHKGRSWQNLEGMLPIRPAGLHEGHVCEEQSNEPSGVQLHEESLNK